MLFRSLEDEFAALRKRLPEEEAQRQALNLLARPDVLIREIRNAEREDPMNQTTRVFLCGIVTGVVAYLLALAGLALAGGEAIAAVQTSSRTWPYPVELNVLLHLAAGIWTIWLYTTMRPRYGSGHKTAAMAGFALWIKIGRASCRERV